MNAAISARLAEVAADTLERLAFIFAAPAADAPAVEESALETVRVKITPTGQRRPLSRLESAAGVYGHE